MLVDGPFDGQEATWIAGMRFERQAPCPLGGDFPHYAAAMYDHEGRYMYTQCGSTDTGEILTDRGQSDGA